MGLKLPFLPAGGPEVTQNFEKLRGAIDADVLTALPTSNLYPGRSIFYLADSTNGVLWHLKYRPASSSAYDWEFAGGSALYHYIATDQTTTSATYVNLTTTGPTLTLPLAGDYDVVFGATLESAAVDRIYATVKLGASAAADTEAISFAIGDPNAESQGGSDSRDLRVTGRAASDAMLMQYRTTLGSTAHFSKRWLKVTPVRVG